MIADEEASQILLPTNMPKNSETIAQVSTRSLRSSKKVKTFACNSAKTVI